MVRELLARWICPKLGRDADAGFRLLIEIQDMKRWLGHEFPEVEVALDRLTVGSVNFWRGIEDKPVEQKYPGLNGGQPWPNEIYSFRETMRRVFRQNSP